MAENCSYTYRGKTYSTDRLIRTLINELPSRSQQESIDFLKKYLGMTEEEITVVKGLIDNRSLGRYKSDGRILLSDLASPDVAYHEAFHRTWRLYLSNTERLQAIKEIKSRKNIQSVIAGYREVYPSLSENELIEEILADEFADYTLNSDFKAELPIKSLFQRFLNFLKKLVGLKTSDIQMIYDKILSKKYVGAPKSAQQYFKDADKILIQGHEFSVEEKNELIQLMTQKFIKAMLELNGNIDLFLSNPTTKVKDLVENYVVANLLSDISDTVDNSDELVVAVYEDVNRWLVSNKFEDSVFINGMIQNLKLIGLEIKNEVDESLEGSLDADEVASREFSPSIEFDPKSKMGKKIKLLLSSLVDTSEKTSVFGFPKPLSWTKSFVQIATKMAGIPTSKFREELKLLPLSYIGDLVDMLEVDTVFANEFISTMAMTENKFYKMSYKEGDIFFFDANSGTRRDKILGEWRNGTIRQMENWDEWKDGVQSLYNRKADNDDILAHLGWEVNSQVPGLRSDLLFVLDHINRYKGLKPDSKKLFKELGIDGYSKALADKQSAFEDTVDLMVNLGSKKLYTLGLNTQQTQVINGIAYAQRQFTPEMSIAEKIDILREFAPMQVSEFNVTKKEDGSYEIHNKWLEKILNGEKLELIIPYLVDTENGDDLEVAKLDEADLMAMHLNGALQGVNISMKHADRGTFFAYTFGRDPLYSKEGSVADTLNILEDNLVEQIELERKFALNMQARNIPVQYIGKDTPGAFFQDIIKDGWKEYLETGKLDRSKVKAFVLDTFAAYKDDVSEYGLTDEYEDRAKNDKGEQYKVKRLKGINNQLRVEYGNLDTLLASAFVNEVSSHIFEVRFFSGDVRSFKSGTDLFKRLAPQSSTGNLSVNDQVTHEFVKQKLNQDFDIVNPKTGEKVSVNPKSKIGLGKDKFFRAVTGAERDDYESHLLELATSNGKPLTSKFTGKQESKLFMMFEDGFIKDYPEKSLDELKKIYEPKFRLYAENYKKANENDGISYMVLPAFKNFMIRQGKWTDGMEMVYQTEMKIASLSNMDDVANIEITVNGETFNPFIIKTQEHNGKKLDGWKKRIVGNKLVSMDAVHTLKTQFGGYSTPEEYYEETKGEMEYVFNTIFKTSQHLLLPSAILGTNLQLMNFSMLTNGIDIYHMGSANKVGAVDAKLAAKNILNDNDDSRNSRVFIHDVAERGLDFYDKEGYFNHDALAENLDILSYLSDWDNLKNQVQIGNKVKDEIKGSTQSLKILLSNLIINGDERFAGAKDIVNSYKEVVHEMVKTNHDNLLKKIGFDLDAYDFTSLDKLKEAVLGASQMQSAPDNVKNAVQNFFADVDSGLEIVPMKNKIENVLYALITNGIVSFDRPGNAYPQAAITGYEKLGSRKFNENGIQVTNQDTLKFYNPIFDEEGNVIKMEPAEIIMPLPDYWIKPLLRWAKTNNLVKAVEKLNADIQNRPELFQFKGLRIPNQQLSSNDIFQVKKFNLPTMQSYVIIPSEMVIKTGGDFDIDKLSIYWAADTQDKIFNGTSEDELQDMYANYLETNEDENRLSFEQFKERQTSSLDRKLIDLEKQILLHPRNAHHLLMPLTDEIFVKDIYDELKKEGLIKEPSKSFTGAILPSTNVKNAIIFVKGKGGVGPVALGITNSATNQADGLKISQFFKNKDGIVLPTKLLFSKMGDVYNIDNYTDNRGTVISEILSQLLTTQVDNVKNPTAVLMNINMQTLGVILYLIRRKINPKSIVLFLQQPIIAKYLQYQRQNESLFNKQADTEESKKGLLIKLKSDLGYSYPKTELPNVYEPVEGKPQFEISDADMLKNAKAGKFDERQLEYLSYFLELQDQSRAFSDFQQTQNSDTKGLKDKQMLDESDVVRTRAYLSGIVDADEIDRIDSQGVISPFYKYGRQRYRIYNQFFALANSRFGNDLFAFKNRAAEHASSLNKDRVRQTIENDFMLFLVHNFVLNKAEFDRLMKGESVAKRVRELKIKIPSNLVLKAFFPMLANTTDRTNQTKIDNLRLFEKEINSLDSNDLRLSMEEIADADLELYKDLVKLLMFQSGLNISPFNYRAIIPVGLNGFKNEFNEYQYLYADILKEAVDKMTKEFSSTNSDEITKFFNKFVGLFSANNPQFLKKHSKYLWNGTYPYTLGKAFDRKTKSTILKPAKGNEVQPQLGDSYHKQYFLELLNNNLDSAANIVKNETPSIFEPSVAETEFIPPVQIDTKKETKTLNKYELFPGVFANQGQTEALDKLEAFLNSSEQEFTLIGRGGTGKTTIIKKVLEGIKSKGGRVLGITVAHKAKKVLGKSIGKDKVKTVASALAIKLDETTGNFVPDMFAREQGRVPIKHGDVIIVDEASMISPAIYKEIMSLKQRGAKVIFMGDNAQLPPVGESEDSPVFNNKNQYKLTEKMRQAATSPIINVGSIIADNIEGSAKLTALSEADRVSKFDPISKSQVIFTDSEEQAIDSFVDDMKLAGGNPDYVKAVTFNNENHNSPQSVKNLNIKIREKLLGDLAQNQFNVGELVTAYDTYSKDIGADEDQIPIHNSEDFIVTGVEPRAEKGTVSAVSKKDGRRTFEFNYNVLYLALNDSDGKPILGSTVPVIASSSVAQYKADIAKLWETDRQLAFALKNQFANLQYGYAITSHKAQGSTYTNTYVFEDNILGPSNAGDAITKNKSLYVAVSRPTTKLVMISDKNEDVTNPKPEKNESSVIKTLPMQPDNIAQIKAGTKTITNRTGKFDDGIYKLPDGTLVEVKFKGMAKVYGDLISFTYGEMMDQDLYAKAEGFRNWLDFVMNNKFSKAFISGEEFRFVYSIKKVEDNITQDDIDSAELVISFNKSASRYSPSLLMYENFVKINRLYTGDEVLPFVGESEYYRYLVPMLIKMNPSVATKFNSYPGMVLVRDAEDAMLSKPILDVYRSFEAKADEAAGVSSRELNMNYINRQADVHTVVHELVHRTIQLEYEKQGEFGDKINALFDYAKAEGLDLEQYGYASPEEFLAEALANPEFMEELNNIPYGRETVWSYLMTLVSDFINNLLNIELKSDSVLAEVVRLSEQVLNRNISELSKEKPVAISELQTEIVNNWNSYFPQYSWMNDAQKQMTAKLVEEGKITLNCKI